MAYLKRSNSRQAQSKAAKTKAKQAPTKGDQKGPTPHPFTAAVRPAVVRFGRAGLGDTAEGFRRSSAIERSGWPCQEAAPMRSPPGCSTAGLSPASGGIQRRHRREHRRLRSYAFLGRNTTGAPIDRVDHGADIFEDRPTQEIFSTPGRCSAVKSA
jgi:hypothetical protein